MDLFRELFDERNLYFDAFDRMDDAIYILDTEKRLVYLNKAAERLDGHLLRDVKGKTTKEVYGLDDEDSPALRAIKYECPVVDEPFTYYVNGRELPQICNSGPIYNNGKLVGAYSIQKDMTKIRDIVEKNISLQHKLNFKESTSPEEKKDPFAKIIGQSDPFRTCVAQARQAARTNSAVMLIGNTGSGKEVFANALHKGSDRAKKPFLTLNCAAIPETLIESILFGTVKGVYTGAIEKEGLLAQADGGTVFLDEINSMPLASQAKLLRVLEEKRIMKLGSNKEVPIDIRIISSTNELPTDAIRNKHLREDLFYRLSVVQIIIPPLRERKEDIPLLTDFFIKKYNNRFNKHVLGIDNDVLSCFMAFQWPGNVRQLKTCIESAMNFAPNGHHITLPDLPVYVFEDTEVAENRYRQNIINERGHISKGTYVSRSKANKPYMPKPIEKQEEQSVFSAIDREKREELINAIRAADGNVAKAARNLGISRQLAYYRLKKYDIK